MKISSNASAKNSTNKSTKKSGKSRLKPVKVEDSGINTHSNSQSTSTSISTAENKDNHKAYAVFDAETIKTIWEQHNNSDTDLAVEVPARLAEDASYKVWDLVNHIKTFARHSGGKVTCDLVNEVLKDCDVPPIFGTTSADWDVIDSNGSYFYQPDKIVELRTEYQKEVTVTIPVGQEITATWPIDEVHFKSMTNYIPSLMYACVYGDTDARSEALNLVAFSSQIGSCCRVLLDDLIQYLAFKQSDKISQRCWRTLQALSFNPYSRDIGSREEYFHLAEILICQLIGPYENIKSPKTQLEEEDSIIKSEQTDDVKEENDATLDRIEIKTENIYGEEMLSSVENLKSGKVYQLQMDDDHDETVIHSNDGVPEFSPYFAIPVASSYVDVLCETIGKLATQNGFFQMECQFLILRRLKRFLEERSNISHENAFIYISRVIRGLTCLGEYAFRELIPFVDHLQIDNIPEHLLVYLARAAVFLKGRDDIFLYEWLEFLCGDKLQPFMTYFANAQQELLKNYFCKRDTSVLDFTVKAVKINRNIKEIVEESQKKSVNKFSISDYFPEKHKSVSSAGDVKIKFKFSGCRPVLPRQNSLQEESAANCNQQQKVPCSKKFIITTRKIFKPLSTRNKNISLSSFHFLKL